MPNYDLAGNPLPEDGSNPVPATARPSMPRQPEAPSYIAPPADGVRYDLAGNPLPPAPGGTSGHQTPTAPPPPRPGGMSYSPGNSGYAPPSGGQTYGGPPPSQARPNPNAARPNVVTPSGDDSSRKVIIGLGGAVVVALVAVFFVMQVPRPIAPVTGYSLFIAKDQSFNSDVPNGWQITDSGDIPGGSDDSNVGGALFKSGAAKIDITTDKVGQLTADALMNTSPDAIYKSKTGMLHRKNKNRAGGVLNGYVEAKPTRTYTAWGETLISEYTASGPKFGMPHPIHGYRASMIGDNLTAEVVCQCPESNWATLKPAFNHVISDLSEGSKPHSAPTGGGGDYAPSGGGFNGSNAGGGIPNSPPPSSAPSAPPSNSDGGGDISNPSPAAPHPRIFVPPQSF